MFWFGVLTSLLSSLLVFLYTWVLLYSILICSGCLNLGWGYFKDLFAYHCCSSDQIFEDQKDFSPWLRSSYEAPPLCPLTPPSAIFLSQQHGHEASHPEGTRSGKAVCWAPAVVFVLFQLPKTEWFWPFFMQYEIFLRHMVPSSMRLFYQTHGDKP